MKSEGVARHTSGTELERVSEEAANPKNGQSEKPTAAGSQRLARLAHTQVNHPVAATLKARSSGGLNKPSTGGASRLRRGLHALTGRPVTITAGVPGTGRTFNRPIRSAVPGEVHAGTSGPAGPLGQKIAPEVSPKEAVADVLLRNAGDIARLAASLDRSLASSESDVFTPPARTRMTRIARFLPGFHPVALRNIVAAEPARSTAALEGSAAMPHDGGSLWHSADIVRQREDNAILAAQFAQSIADAAAIIARVENQSAHSPEMRSAVAALDKTLRGTALLHVDNMRILADSGDARLAFATRRLAEISGEIKGIKDKALADRAHVGARLKALAEASTALQEEDHQMPGADALVDIATERFNVLSTRLEALTASLARNSDTAGAPRAESSTEARGRAQRAALQQEAREARNLLDNALQMQMRQVQRMQRFYEIQQQFVTLMGEHAQAGRLLHAVDQAEAPLQRAANALPAQGKPAADVTIKAPDAAHAAAATGDVAAPRDTAEADIMVVATDAVIATPEGSAVAAQAREAEAIKAAKAAVLAQLVNAVHVFPSGGGPALRTQLTTIADKLLGPAAPIPIQATGAIRLITQAAADSGLDGAQMAAVLAEMGRRSVGHWVDRPLATTIETRVSNVSGIEAQPDAARALRQNVEKVSRTLASLPRGVTLLHLISADGNGPPDAERLQALRVFWAADEAVQNLGPEEENVRVWLEQARDVAISKNREADRSSAAFVSASDTPAKFDTPHAPTPVLDDVALGAYTAVRNGYRSNAPGSPYDLHDQRLRKAIDEWVIRVGGHPTPAASGMTATARIDSSATTPTPSRMRRALPHLVKSPFRSSVLGRAFTVGESMGLQSLRIKVDTALDHTLSDLETATANPENSVPPTDRQAIAAFLAHLREQQGKGKHLSEYTLGTADVKALALRLAGPQGASRALPPGPLGRPAAGAPGDAPAADRRNRLRKRPPLVLPPIVRQVCADKVSAYEAISRLSQHVSGPGDVSEAARAADAALAAEVQLIKSRRFATKADVLTYFKPLIENSRLRDRLRVGGGGALGVNLPSLPYGSVSPIVSPIFTAERARSDEAFMQLFMPILGFEMTFGGTKTRATEATVGVAAGPALTPNVSIQGAFTLRGARQRMRMNGTVVRFFRKRHQDAEMRANMSNALDSIVRWDSLTPERGARYGGPMEALLSRNPLVSVAAVEGRTSTDTVAARLAARLPSAHFNDAHGIAQTLGLELGISAEVERVKEARTEQGGKVRIEGARGDTAQQRVNAGATLNVSPLSNQSVQVGEHGKHGAVQRESLPLQWSITRELAWFKAQHELSPFVIEDQQDCDIDRHAATPDDMLGEIESNREMWLMRCIETLEPDAEGNKDNADNRRLAATHLDAFEKSIRALGRESNYCHYNVNYSMRGESGVQIDVYRGLKRLATQRGDDAAAQEAQDAIDDILRMRSTWRPLMLIVRERARDSTTTGWRSLLRWQHIGNIDAQRTAAQFPPP